MARLQAKMDALSHAGALAPPMHWDPSIIKKKLGAKQRKAIQRLRDVILCVRSEAARFGPERCGAIYCSLSRLWARPETSLSRTETAETCT